MASGQGASNDAMNTATIAIAEGNQRGLCWVDLIDDGTCRNGGDRTREDHDSCNRLSCAAVAPDVGPRGLRG